MMLSEIQRHIAMVDIGDFTSLLGQEICNTANEEDNLFLDVGKSVISCIESCDKESDFSAMNKMCVAITGYGLETLIMRVSNSQT